MAHVTVNRMLSGEDVPSVETLEKIANALGYGVVDFIMMAVKSHTGFENVQLIETFQGLSSAGRAMLLDVARSIARNDSKTP